MYNRYIPTPDGCYERTIMDEAAENAAAPAYPRPVSVPAAGDTVPSAACPETAPVPSEACPGGFRLPKLETGDWLVLLILLLLLTDGDGVDLPCLLVAAAVFLFF